MLRMVDGEAKDLFSVYCYMYLAILLSIREANTAGGNTYLERMRRMQKA